MKTSNPSSEGIKRLIVFYRRQFRTEENLAYYHAKDLARAERRYIKCALDGRCAVAQTSGAH